MPNFTSLEEIVANGFCMSCGLCKGCAPDGVIGMAWTANGQLRPQASRELTAEEQAAIVRLCPGVTQEGPFDELSLNSTDGAAGSGRDEPWRGNAVWGELRRVSMAWATDPDVRFRASTGGFVSAINRYLLESGRASFILQVRANPTNALESDPVFIRDADELTMGSQSRYASTSPLSAIRAALDVGEPFAVSLKPCDIAGIRNLAREDERVDRLIVCTQALICGSVPTLKDSLNVLRRHDVDPLIDPPRTFQWRGDGCPGPMVATMPDGREIRATYRGLYVDNPWSTQFRCKVCPDAIGLQADIATGDSWPDADPIGESEGTNIVAARTARGLDILAEAERLGYVEVHDVEDRALDDTQPHHTRLRQTVGARLAGAMEAGAPSPDFAGLALDDCAAALEAEDLANVVRGTIQRVRAGHGDEPAVIDD
jgi:coenzyme F420 hydrogenase subunit beta